MTFSENRCAPIGSWPEGMLFRVMLQLRIQFPVVAEDALFIEGDAAVACEISLDVRPRGHAVMQSDQTRNIALERLHPLRKGVAQARNDLEQRQIDTAYPYTAHIRARDHSQYRVILAK